MNEREMLISQYHAALEMLKQTILACPDALWHSSDDRTAFWQIAYHALFFTHLYVQVSKETFSLWSGHREEYRFESEAHTPLAEPATKTIVLEYLAFCQHQVVEKVSTMVLDAASGFDWLPFTKFELQLYSIRHIQQHVGELMERLGAKAMEIDWVGTYRANIDGRT
jgi:hypothetical protein